MHVIKVVFCFVSLSKDIALLIITELTFICTVLINAYDKLIPVHCKPIKHIFYSTVHTYTVSVDVNAFYLEWIAESVVEIQSTYTSGKHHHSHINNKLKWDRQRLRLSGTAAQTNEIRPNPRIHFVTHTYAHAQCTHTDTRTERQWKTHTFMSCSTIDSLSMRFYHRKMFAQMRFNNCIVVLFLLIELNQMNNQCVTTHICTHAHTKRHTLFTTDFSFGVRVCVWQYTEC